MYIRFSKTPLFDASSALAHNCLSSSAVHAQIFGKASVSFHADAQFAHSLEFNVVRNLDGSNEHSNLENNNSAVQHLDGSNKYSNEEKDNNAVQHLDARVRAHADLGGRSKYPVGDMTLSNALMITKPPKEEYPTTATQPNPAKPTHHSYYHIPRNKQIITQHNATHHNSNNTIQTTTATNNTIKVFDNHKFRYNIDRHKTHHDKDTNYRNQLTNLTVDKYNSSYKFYSLQRWCDSYGHSCALPVGQGTWEEAVASHLPGELQGVGQLPSSSPGCHL